jgi:hypothetical protein
LTGFTGLTGVRIGFGEAGLGLAGLPALAGAEPGPLAPVAPFGGAPPALGAGAPVTGEALGAPTLLADLLAAPAL